MVILAAAKVRRVNDLGCGGIDLREEPVRNAAEARLERISRWKISRVSPPCDQRRAGVWFHGDAGGRVGPGSSDIGRVEHRTAIGTEYGKKGIPPPGEARLNRAGRDWKVRRECRPCHVGISRLVER